MKLFNSKPRVPTQDESLPGREQQVPVAATHFVLGTQMQPDTDKLEVAIFGLGCFWGAERKYWEAPGVCSTAVGYAAGFTPNPSYEEVCSGRTGHNEVVRVIFDPARTSYSEMLRIFWEDHDPTQGMRQGNDNGTQYRSGIYVFSDEQARAAEASRESFQKVLSESGYGSITTEIGPVPPFYFAEDYHQQYLAKNPGGYCGLGGTGLTCPVGTALSAEGQ